MRNITLAELEGFQEALLQLAVPADLGTNDLVDIVGTGGDGKHLQYINTSQLHCSRNRTKSSQTW